MPGGFPDRRARSSPVLYLYLTHYYQKSKYWSTPDYQFCLDLLLRKISFSSHFASSFNFFIGATGAFLNSSISSSVIRLFIRFARNGMILIAYSPYTKSLQCRLFTKIQPKDHPPCWQVYSIAYYAIRSHKSIAGLI